MSNRVVTGTSGQIKSTAVKTIRSRLAGGPIPFGVPVVVANKIQNAEVVIARPAGSTAPIIGISCFSDGSPLLRRHGQYLQGDMANIFNLGDTFVNSSLIDTGVTVYAEDTAYIILATNKYTTASTTNSVNNLRVGKFLTMATGAATVPTGDISGAMIFINLL